MERKKAIEYINSQEPDFLRKAKKKGWICPECDNGAGTDGDGLKLTPDGKRYKCFKCGASRTVIDLYGLAKNLDIENFDTLLLEAARYYRVEIEGAGMYHNQPRTEQNTHTHIHTQLYTQEPDYTAFYKEAHTHLQETDYRRGLSQETLDRFNIGFTKSYSGDNKGATGWAALIIPTSQSSYVIRNTDKKADNKARYRKQGNTHIFNETALETAKRPIFITEGEIDALSIIDAGGEAIATGSISNAGANSLLIKALEKNTPAQPLIIALDNDEGGRSKQPETAAELEKLGIDFIEYNIAGEYKDANEALNAEKEALRARIAEAEGIAIAQRKERLEALKNEYLQNNAYNHLEEFIKGIHESVNTPCISTGFKKLDSVLDGGLYEGLYTVGAISSLGKTTLILQIADQIAQSGLDVLIFSLEMARTELMSKSISRHTLIEVLNSGGRYKKEDAKTARGITAGKRYEHYSDRENTLIATAENNYSLYAEHIFITEGMGEVGAKEIRETVEKHIAVTGNKPVVVIDYLQLLAPYNERYTDKQNIDKAIMELKRISRDYKIPVLAISSLNRQNYSEAIHDAAFKESGAIEYSSDVLIGLQLAGAGKADFDALAEKAKEDRKIELVILKNRNGRVGENIKYYYYPLFNYFKELEGDKWD